VPHLGSPSGHCRTAIASHFQAASMHAYGNPGQDREACPAASLLESEHVMRENICPASPVGSKEAHRSIVTPKAGWMWL
jgi:hypothetical protein